MLSLVPLPFLIKGARGMGTTLSEREILAVLETANDTEIESGKLADKKTADSKVRGFAEMMVNEHKGANRKVAALALKLKLEPRDSAPSRSLKSDGDTGYSLLKELSGASFDHTYVDQAVSAHQAVLDTIDQTLLPSAKTDDMKSLLKDLRTAVATHLKHAERLQRSLGKG